MSVGGNKKWTGKAETSLSRMDVLMSAIEGIIASSSSWSKENLCEELADARCQFFRGISDLIKRASRSEKGDGLPRGKPKRKRSRKTSRLYNPKKKVKKK